MANKGRMIGPDAWARVNPISVDMPLLRVGISMAKAQRNIVVQNTLGLHARPAMQFVDAANQFSSNITVIKGGAEPGEADGKSVMQMIILAAEQGTPLTLAAEGEDAETAVATLAKLFDDKFGEE
jgi:phosphocarrier protein HPr